MEGEYEWGEPSWESQFAPAWAHQMLGKDFFYQIAFVGSFYGGQNEEKLHEDLLEIVKFPSLLHLDLFETSFTDDHVKHLKKMKQLMS